MRCNFWKGIGQMLLGAGLVALSGGAALAVTGTITFQNGMNGYTGTFDRVIDERLGANERNGSDWPQIFLDGYQPDDPATTGNEYSPDAQALIKFGNLFGNGPNQIPAGATILDAKFTVQTSTTGNAQTNGAWGVAQLLQPFDGSTSYTTSFGGTSTLRGAWHEDGYSNRVQAAFQGPAQGERVTTDITGIVQNWASNPAGNHGLAIQAGFVNGGPGGTTDGWGILSTGHPVVDSRPSLQVTYTNDPVTLRSFQRGDSNGYSSDTNAFVRSGNNIFGVGAYQGTEGPVAADPNHRADDVTYNGLTGDASFTADTTIAPAAQENLASRMGYADGLQFQNNAAGVAGLADSFEDFGIFKFDSVFGNGATQSPANIPVAKAYLVLTTGNSGSAMSNGAITVHGLKRDWDFDVNTPAATLHSDFGDVPGLQLPGSDGDSGDITGALDEATGLIWGSEVWLDVTDHLENIRTGASPNYGFAVRTDTTADGWQYIMNGFADNEALRPRLVVASSSAAIVSPSLAGDFNADGVVDAADYTVWRDNRGTSFDLGGNGDESGVSAGIVDDADYALWKSNFGSVAGGGPLASGGAIPEPGTALLAALAAGLAGFLGKRQRS